MKQYYLKIILTMRAASVMLFIPNRNVSWLLGWQGIYESAKHIADQHVLCDVCPLPVMYLAQKNLISMLFFSPGFPEHLCAMAMVCLLDFEAYAEKYLPKIAWDFFAAGADECSTRDENILAYKR